jgi:hypothetical protein
MIVEIIKILLPIKIKIMTMSDIIVTDLFASIVQIKSVLSKNKKTSLEKYFYTVT